MSSGLTGEKGQRGASAVEFAIILPLLVVLIFGIIEFGLLLYNKQVITNASREGARAGIVQDTPRVPFTTIESVVQTYASNHLVSFASGIVLPTVSVQNTTAGGHQCVNFGDNLTVNVTYPYTFLAFNGALNALKLLGVTVSPVGTSNILTLTAQTVMRCE